MFEDHELSRPVASTVLLLADFLIFLLTAVLLVRSIRVDRPSNIVYAALFGACLCGFEEAKNWKHSWKLHLVFFCSPVVLLVGWVAFEWRAIANDGESIAAMILISIPTTLFSGVLAGLAFWRGRSK